MSDPKTVAGEAPAPHPQNVMIMSALEWARERFANTLRLAAEKNGDDRAGWLEDAAYWKAIVIRLERADELEAEPKGVSGAPAPHPQSTLIDRTLYELLNKTLPERPWMLIRDLYLAIKPLEISADSGRTPSRLVEQLEHLADVYEQTLQNCQTGTTFSWTREMQAEIVRYLGQAAVVIRALQRGAPAPPQLRAALEDALIVTRNYYAQAISRAELERHQAQWEAALAALPSPPQPEICVCAAVLCEGEIVRGHRHDDAFMTAGRIGVNARGCEQGFVTSRNRFVGRIEGANLQRAAGISSAQTGEPLPEGSILFSEDLYLKGKPAPEVGGAAVLPFKTVLIDAVEHVEKALRKAGWEGVLGLTSDGEVKVYPHPPRPAGAAALPQLSTDRIWTLLNEADDAKERWIAYSWQQWFAQIVDAVSELDGALARQEEAGAVAALPLPSMEKP